ncbi:MAG: glycerophosphodiester phosphodiesterase [Bulleidia sp.]
MITAHSGCDGTPDNSMAYLRYAFASGADCVEVDIRPDQNTLVLSHDPCETDAVTLKDAFTLLARHPEKKMNCDLKTPGLEKKVYGLALECGCERQLIYTGTVDPEGDHEIFAPVEIAMNIENLCPEIYEDLLQGELSKRAAECLDFAAGRGIRVINLEYHLFDLIKEDLEKRKLSASVWTVNDASQAERFLNEALISNITTRNLKQTLAIREKLC